MKKMKLLLVMFVIAMLALCGCSKEKKANQNDDVENVPTQEVLTNEDDTASVSYTDNTTTITLVNQEGVWYFEDDMEAWVDQTEAYEIVDAASHLTSVDAVDDAGALADYGLETPAYTVIVKGAEGSETIIYIGNILEDGTYYATIGEKDTVYIISEQLAGALQFDRELLKEIIEEEIEEEIPEEEEFIEEEIIEEEIIEEEIIEEEIPEEDSSESEE